MVLHSFIIIIIIIIIINIIIIIIITIIRKHYFVQSWNHILILDIYKNACQ